MSYMNYTEAQLKFFSECGKKSRDALIKKYGKEVLKRKAIERAENLNKKRWGKD